MKNTKMKQSIAALAMAAVVAVSLLGYGCGILITLAKKNMVNLNY